MKTRILYCLMVIVLACSCGCTSSKTLTRSRAKEIVEKAPFFQPAKRRLQLTDNEYQACVRSGYWKEGLWGNTLTSAGRALFSDGGLYVVAPRAPMTAHPVRAYIVDIDGITDESGPGGSAATTKIVKYKWSWNFNDQPEELKNLCKDHPSKEGEAELRLYDDGWRVEGTRPNEHDLAQ